MDKYCNSIMVTVVKRVSFIQSEFCRIHAIYIHMVQNASQNMGRRLYQLLKPNLRQSLGEQVQWLLAQIKIHISKDQNTFIQIEKQIN